MAGVRCSTAACLGPRPLPTPAVTNKLPLWGDGSVSINAGKPGGGPGGRSLVRDTPATEEQAVVMVVEAMVA